MELWEKSNEVPVQQEIMRKKRAWIGHTVRKKSDIYIKEPLEWNTQGTGKRGRLPNTWKRTVLAEGDGKILGRDKSAGTEPS